MSECPSGSSRRSRGAKAAEAAKVTKRATKTAKAKISKTAKPAPADAPVAEGDAELPEVDVASTPVRRRTGRRCPRSAVARLEDPPPASGLELITRVSRAIELELMQIERIVGGRQVPVALRSEAERRARTLASLARTLGAVRRLRAEEEKPNTDDDDAVPRDLDELRRELSRRLALMDAGGAPLPARDDE